MPTVYLDACCLNRPFDDQSQPRIRLEAEAVLFVLQSVATGATEWVGSTVLDFEINVAPDAERWRRLVMMCTGISRRIDLTDDDINRAVILERAGIADFDALHLACAERAGVDVFLTTDDRLLRQASRLAGDLRVRVENPATWVRDRGQT